LLVICEHFFLFRSRFVTPFLIGRDDKNDESRLINTVYTVKTIKQHTLQFTLWCIVTIVQRGESSSAQIKYIPLI